MPAGATGTPTSLGIPTINGDVDNPTATGINSIAAAINTLLGAIAEGQLALTDITTGNVSAAKHGFAPKLPNSASVYLDGTGAYSSPVITTNASGTFAARPAAATGNANTVYYATDKATLYYSTGSAWLLVGVDDLAITAAKIASGTITDTQIAAANKDGAAGTASLRTLGTGAAQAAAGNDSRLSDTRTPSALSVTTGTIAAGAVTQAKLAIKYDSGVGSFASGTDTAVSFATAFTAPPAVVTTSVRQAGDPGNADDGARVASITSSGFLIENREGAARTYNWIAVGV